jgi:trk system potassium uptake protein TrkA
MRIFIVGAGEVGFHIATSLVQEGHDLVIVEKDEDRVAELQSELDVMAIAGDGCNPHLLKENAVAQADLFFAVSNDDAANMLSALTARRLGVPRAVVRVGTAIHRNNPLIQCDEQIVPIFPEQVVADEIYSLTRIPGAQKVHFFADDQLALIRAKPSSKVDIYGQPLKGLKGPPGWIVGGIQRNEELLIPRGDSVLHRGDRIYAIGRRDAAAEYLESIGVHSEPIHRVVIAGGGQVGYWLSKQLLKDKIDVTVIQRGEQRAFDFAAELPNVTVLRGDARDPAVLREAEVGESDFFVATTQNDETNILSCLLARELGAKVEVALYHRPVFQNVLRAIQIDLPISPRLMMAGQILKMVHGREIITMDVLEGGKAEVVEFEVPAKARVLGKPIAELHFPRTAIVGAVQRGREVFVPGGDFVFQERDRVLVFTLTSGLRPLEKKFRAR